jgi:hypothetical protein
MQGMGYLLPDYFLDNRRMEVRLRPAEGNYQVTYTAPTYDDTGAVVQNAEIRLGDGPPREIVIDFINRIFGPALMPGTVYDTSLVLGDSPLDCEPQPSSNMQLADICGCEGAAEDADPDLPAVFVHGDELAPGSFVALYASESMEPAFPTDIPRTFITEPCCLCNYFIEQVYFALSSNFLPITPRFDPAFSNNVRMQYTWSRVPHGMLEVAGQDGTWGGYEVRAQNYLDKQGVLMARPFTNQRSLSRTLTTAYFPSPQEADDALVEGGGIGVPGALHAGDPKLLGGAPATGGISQGQPEQIILDVAFDTYVSVKTVRVNFLAGKDMEVPPVYLVGIPPADRTGWPTTRGGFLLGQTTVSFSDVSVPNSKFYDSQDIQNGEVLFQVNLAPSYDDMPFWDTFYQEFHLVFGGRPYNRSMGIYSIEFEIDALTTLSALTETIFIPERRYYVSSFTPAAGENPEENLTGMDSCSAYWRNTTVGETSGGNRFRSYAWGQKVSNETGLGQGGGQPTIGGDIDDLENLQVEEYDKARNLMTSPYTYTFSSFFPLDEQRWLNFLGGSQPSWNTSLSVSVSDIDQVSSQDGDLIYGEVSVRSVWHAPGHAWIHELVEDYMACCEGCGDSQVVEYRFAHLHDQLSLVETAGFWTDFERGSFGIGSVLPSTQGQPDVRFINEGELFDQNGQPISADILNASGFRIDANGDLLMTGHTEQQQN